MQKINVEATKDIKDLSTNAYLKMFCRHSYLMDVILFDDAPSVQLLYQIYFGLLYDLREITMF